jgi:probable lipoprotein NlpC
MKYFLIITMFFFSARLFAAPLDGGYSQAPRKSASAEEKAQAFLDARYKVINTAGKYENTPYRYGGIDSSGLDCSGFIYLTFKDALDVSLPRTSDGLYSWAEKIPREKAQPGDLLFFKTDSSGKISHVGLYLGEGQFIHSASSGPHTGVIYSSLEETYWNRAFTGAGRAFPEASPGYVPVLTGVKTKTNNTPYDETNDTMTGRSQNSSPSVFSGTQKTHWLFSAAFAPSWGGFLKNGDFLRGFASQFRVAAETYFGVKMLIGLELRPEYDGALGVFRIPLTLSWGPSDKFSIFAGPVFSFGDPALATENGKRRYKGGTSFLGAAGVNIAPFAFKVSNSVFSPYIEAAWQYYSNDSDETNANADFSAGFRFSTGLRWTLTIK